tara:strand:- start:3559 stop:5244 length:1686 start_codon:yes stop_codon:yes gene_type:complete
MEKKIEYKIIIDDSKSAKTLSQLEKSAEQLNQELKELDPRSQDFKNLAKAAQGVNKEIEEINNSVEGLKFEDKLMAMDGASKVLAGSVATLVGGFGLLGIESEKLQFLETQATNAIAFAIGIKDLSEGAGQLAVAFKKAGISAKLFGAVTKKALIATGIGALVVALGTVIAYWDEIIELVQGTTKSIEEQSKVINEQISDSELQVELLRMEYENVQLRGDAGVVVTEEIKKQLLLQQEQNVLLLEALELDLARVKAENEEVTTWEMIKIAASGYLGVGYQAKTIAESMNSESEETIGLTDKITEAKKRQLTLEKQLLLIGQDIKEEKGLEEFQNREPVESVNEIETVGLSEMDMEKIQSDAEFEDLVNSEKMKSNELLAKATIENQAKLDQARASSVDNLIMLAGAESRIGRALLVAKQVMLAKELIMEAKKTITFAAQSAAQATVATATGAAKTAAVGFPANIPLLIGYAVQAAGIIGAISSAVRSSKSAAGGKGGSAAMPQAPRIPSGGRGAPNTANAQNADTRDELQATPTTRTYVLSGDVRNQQEADAKLAARRVLS